ncbi:MAG: panthothenate synthetase [Tepidisphaeraceae bacterium]
MRVLLFVSLPNEPFNTYVRNGSASAKMGRILEAIKPEAAYFTELEGRRTGILAVDLSDASKIPSLAEPWFLQFNAEVRVHPTMTPEDLKKSGIDDLGKKWGS